MNKIHWETSEVRNGMRAVIGSITLPSGRKRIEYSLVSVVEIETAHPATLRLTLALIVHSLKRKLDRATDLPAPSYEAVRAAAYAELRKLPIVW
jgi:hypothetical protein